MTKDDMALRTVRNLPDEVRLGEALAALGRKIGLTNEDVDALQQARDKTPAEPLREVLEMLL